MNDPLDVRVTALAAAHIRTAEAWWRENRPAAPAAIRQELERAFALIAARPEVGSRATNVLLQDVRRIYLPRIKYHVYYHVIGEREGVEVVALWHARRGGAPPI